MSTEGISGGNPTRELLLKVAKASAKNHKRGNMIREFRKSVTKGPF